jgi:hypothetical protein
LRHKTLIIRALGVFDGFVPFFIVLKIWQLDYYVRMVVLSMVMLTLLPIVILIGIIGGIAWLARLRWGQIAVICLLTLATIEAAALALIAGLWWFASASP